MKRRIGVVIATVGLVGCMASNPEGDPSGAEVRALAPAALSQDLTEKGAFTCELTIGPGLTPQQAPLEIERDRMLMGHPGMRQKMLPLSFGDGANLLMGGRYLFDTVAQAADYEDLVLHRYVLDGVQFVDRSYFLDHDCRYWRTIGAHDFADFRSHQVVVRTERWRVPSGHNWNGLLHSRWRSVRDAAEARGLSSVWLLYSDRDDYVQLVYYADRVQPNDPMVPDFASLGALAGAPPLGAAFDDQTSWTRDMDKTQWVFTVWQPFVLGDQGAPSVFPYSPPFPGLLCGDGLCAPSQGETYASCPQDCAPRCGDAICEPDEGEDVHGCPGDCRVPSSPIQPHG